MADGFDQIEKQVLAQCLETFRAFALRAFTDMQIDTRLGGSDGGAHGSPVRSGRYAASLRISLNSVDNSVEPAVKPYPRADLSPAERIVANHPLADALAVLRQFKFGDKIIISNSLPYAGAIESSTKKDGAGWSPKAPGGVFRPSLLWTQARYQAAFDQLGLNVSVNIQSEAS